MFRRSLLKFGLSSIASSALSWNILNVNSSYSAEQKFDGFDGQSVVWGGIGYLPENGRSALPNFYPLLEKKDESGVLTLNNLLTKALEEVPKSTWETKGFRLSIGEGGKGGTARFGMIMAVSAELTIQDSRTDIISFRVLRLIAYNFLFQIDPGGTKIIACYPVGGRAYSYRPFFDETSSSEYYLRMFSTSSTEGETITSWYRNKLKNYPFEDIKTGLNYQVTDVSLKPKVEEALNILNINKADFKDLIGFAATMSFGKEMKVSMVPYKDSNASTGALALNFRNKEAFSLSLNEPDIVIEPTVHLWTTQYQDHPRDPNKFAQKIKIFVQFRVKSDFFGVNFNQLITAEEVQSVFKKEEFRRTDLATIYLLIEQLLEKTSAAIRNPGKRQELLQGFRKDFETNERNREIKPYIEIKVHKQTAAKFEEQCQTIMEL